MNDLKQSFRLIPWWAYLLVLLVLSTAALYTYNRYQAPVTGENGRQVNDYYVIEYVDPGGPADKAGLIAGDTLNHIHSYTITEWFSRDHGQTARDTLIFGRIRNGIEAGVPVTLASQFSNSPGYFWFINILIAVCSIGGLYILVKRPGEKASRLFFIYLQLFMIMMNGEILGMAKPSFVIASIIFIMLTAQVGPTIVHFHLNFPRPVTILDRYSRLPWLFHLAGFLVSIVYSIAYLHDNTGVYPQDSFYYVTERAGLAWVTLNFCVAVGIVFYQFVTNKDSLLRNQLRLVIIGSLFGLLTPIVLTFFYDQILPLQGKFPSLLPFLQGTGGMFMILCILIALFRYRIWNIEIVLKKLLLYLAATAIIVFSYLGLILFIDEYSNRESNLIRFIALGVSVLFFLILRDRLQHLIDRLFNRESYDSATAVSEFEANLAGIYQTDALRQKIVQGIDDIFHFKSFILTLKKSGLTYEFVFPQASLAPDHDPVYEVPADFEEKLRASKVFSPRELTRVPSMPGIDKGELIVPLIANGQPAGFFLCGQKKSERIYSQQDIRVLSLLARRVIALFHTAALYQKDLDRQLMLERERARISQDMHDDIGAGLTKIAMISEAPVREGEKEPEISDRMARVAASSRDMISRLNVIVWALNPKYDNIESLVGYLRRYFGEYLENCGIRFTTDIPETIPDINITPDTRRNIFYSIQEAIHNAVKHASCSEIGMTIETGAGSVEITIGDNGKGFDPDNIRQFGNGLNNMKKRTLDLGGTFRLESSPRNGTKIHFTIGLKENATKGGLT